MPAGSSYDRDILLWSEQPAGVLRRLSVGQRLNATVDWPHHYGLRQQRLAAVQFPALLASDADALTLATLLTEA